jgi:hypothetical protein
LICGSVSAQHSTELTPYEATPAVGEVEAQAGEGDQFAEACDTSDEAPGEPAEVESGSATVVDESAAGGALGAAADELNEFLQEPEDDKHELDSEPSGELDQADEAVREAGQAFPESTESDYAVTETSYVSTETGDGGVESDYERYERIDIEHAGVETGLVDHVGIESGYESIPTDYEGIETGCESPAVPGPEADEDEADVSPVLSRLLTRQIDLLAGIPEGVDPTERPVDDELGAVLDRPRQIDVAEEACYVRIMSDGLASVREVRSLDLYPGRSLLRLENIPTSVVEDSIFLSVWHPVSEVVIRSYRLAKSDESAELLVEVSSPDRVHGAHLEVYYLVLDLQATLGYSGMYDAEGASLRLSEWLTVTNLCGKHFTGAGFSFDLSDLGFEHEIASAVTLRAGEKSRFLCRDHVLSPATAIVKAESGPSGETYEITELIKVEGLKDQDLMIPRSTAKIYSMGQSGFSTLVADGPIFKSREYSWFTVETLNRPDVRVQRAQTGDEVTGTGIRDVAYMINIENRSSVDAIVTIYEWIGGNWFLRSATIDTKQVPHSRDPERPDYATFTVEVAANSSQALLYKARISDRPER